MVKRTPGGLTDNEARTLRAIVALHADGYAEVYGFLLAEALADQGGRAIAYSALYDSLKRLERLGYLAGRWEDPDLAAAAKELVGPLLSEREAMFVDAVTKVLRSCGLAAAYKPAGLTAKQLADTLYATGRGLKYAATREAFLEGMAVAARAMCMPLRDKGDARPPPRGK